MTPIETLMPLMLRHAMREAPKECCGLLFQYPNGNLHGIERTNSSPDPEHEFLLSHEQYIETCDFVGAIPFALYHSHPTGRPVPSVKDCRLMDAFEVCQMTMAMVIIGLHPPLVRVYEKRDHVYAMVEEVTG